MTDHNDISQLCRLCLVKDKVNHSIFGESGDFGGLLRKINSCLPVSISKNDGLPKRICDACSTKLDLFYQFRNDSIKAEQQLLQWFHKNNTINNEEDLIKMNTAEIKEEIIEIQDNKTDTVGYNIKEIVYPTSTSKDELPTKRPKRTSAMKALEHMESEDDDDDFDEGADDYGKDDTDDSDKEGSYQEGPSTSVNDQPGPSGMGKGSSQAPYSSLIGGNIKEEEIEIIDMKNFKNESLKKWKCNKCYEEFDTRKNLKTHRKIHLPRDKSPTTFTLNNYKFNACLEIFICNFCSAEYDDENEIKKHLNDNHLRKFECKICNQYFLEPYKFCAHLQKHEGGNYFCPMCSYETPRRTCMQTHINRIHLHKFIYNCKKCGKGFNDQVLFKEHDNEHLGIKPFICVVCNKSYGFSKYLLAHQVRYHVVNIEGILQTNQCSVCMKIFKRDSTLKNHIKTRHENNGIPREKNKLCDICGKGFSRNDKLQIHYRIHTGVKPYVCSYCPKSFIKKEYLVMHERVHSGEKPYSCEYCGKCFNQSASLRIHVRGHTGERPYTCTFCEQGFISSSALNFHKKNYCTGGQEFA